MIAMLLLCGLLCPREHLCRNVGDLAVLLNIDGQEVGKQWERLVVLAAGVFGAAFIMFICGWISWKDPTDQMRFFGGLVVGLILSGLWFTYWFVRFAFG